MCIRDSLLAGVTSSLPGSRTLAVGYALRNVSAISCTLAFSPIISGLLYVVMGGALAGLGGAYLSLAYAPCWLENMTAGRGWIAVALVIFALKFCINAKRNVLPLKICPSYDDICKSSVLSNSV